MFFTGVCAITGLIFLLLIGVPIGIAMIVASTLGLTAMIGAHAALLTVSRIPFEFGASWEMSALPMFFLMGALASHTGMTASLFRAAKIWVGRFPGGLAIATNFACAGFSAASGSSLATTVAVGKIAIPEMTKAKYDLGFSAAVCACSGTLGSLIPPSIIMIIYGIFAEQSVAKLFIAGWIPGLLTATTFVLVIILRARIDPHLFPRIDMESSWRDRIHSLFDIAPITLLIILIIASLYMGWATPTESATLGVGFTLAIATLRGSITITAICKSVMEACLASANILFIAAGAVLLTKLLSIAGFPVVISSFVNSVGANQTALLLSAALICIVLGCFMDPMGLMLVTLPIFIPVFENAGIDMIWFGILMVKFVEIGLITPPVGFNVYAIKSVVGDSISVGKIFKNVFWLFCAELVVLGLLIAFPEITMFLPNSMR